jgi:hypothetical protein
MHLSPFDRAREPRRARVICYRPIRLHGVDVRSDRAQSLRQNVARPFSGDVEDFRSRNICALRHDLEERFRNESLRNCVDGNAALEERAGRCRTYRAHLQSRESASITAAAQQLLPENRDGVLTGEDQPLIIAEPADRVAQWRKIHPRDQRRRSFDHIRAGLAQLIGQRRRLLRRARDGDALSKKWPPLRPGNLLAQDDRPANDRDHGRREILRFGSRGESA